MVNLTVKHCEFSGCVTQPSFNYAGQRKARSVSTFLGLGFILLIVKGKSDGCIADDCSILHTRQPGLLEQVTTILESNSNASICKTRAHLALPQCAACSYHDEAFIYCSIGVRGPQNGQPFCFQLQPFW